MEQSLLVSWYVAMFIPAIFWYFLIKEFNAKAHAKFPCIVYSILYLIPILGHCWIAWSFLNDLKEVQIKSRADSVPVNKTYITKFVLPDIFLVLGLNIFVFIGIFIFLIPVIGSYVGNSLIWLATFVPFISFIWIAWGFWSTFRIVKNIKSKGMSI